MRQTAFVCTLLIASLAGRLSTFMARRPPQPQQRAKSRPRAAQASTFKLPDPSGTFGIGRIGYEWIDASRPDGYSADPHAHRVLMVYLWYPSARGAAGEMAPYLPGANQMDADRDVQHQMKESTARFGR